MPVPTLDIDLAWHTHQLSPSSYYVRTVTLRGRFLDHNDRVREDSLAEAFEFTCYAYQDTYGTVYSECMCWYCETVRVGIASGTLPPATDGDSSTGKRMGLRASIFGRVSLAEKINESFHASSSSFSISFAHISNHHACRVDGETPLRAAARSSRKLTRRRVRWHARRAVQHPKRSCFTTIRAPLSPCIAPSCTLWLPIQDFMPEAKTPEAKTPVQRTVGTESRAAVLLGHAVSGLRMLHVGRALRVVVAHSGLSLDARYQLVITMPVIRPYFVSVLDRCFTR